MSYFELCIFESQSVERYNICSFVGRNETFWKKFARMFTFAYEAYDLAILYHVLTCPVNVWVKTKF